MEIYDELKEYTTDYSKTFRTVNKSIANTTQREFLDKKIWFRESDTLRTEEEE